MNELDDTDKQLLRLLGEDSELLVGGKFGHNVMVVCIKPLSHFHRGNVQAIFLIATGHGKIQIDLVVATSLA